MPEVYLSLGSNMGNRLDYLSIALHKITQFGSFRLLSHIYETVSWGYEGKDFLNLVCCIETDLHAEDFLIRLQEIEVFAGREKHTGKNYSDRLIDIDILFYNSMVYTSTTLTIPHPLMHLRMFCLQPMMDIAPDFEHPVFHVRVSDLYNTQSGTENNKISLFLKSEQFRKKYSL